jgi:transposase
VTGRPDFLYIADSKLCSFDNMQHIHQAGGRFITVMPRTRQEDAQFRESIQTRTPDWELLWDRPNPRHRNGPRDRWYVFRSPVPSMEVWPITWVWSALLTLRHRARRQRNISAALEQLQAMHQGLIKARARLRGAKDIDKRVAQILAQHSVGRYLTVKRIVREEHSFKQTRRGRPGAHTAYRRITRKRFDIEFGVEQAAVDYDEKSDGMFPLLSNDRKLSPAQVLQAYKGQPKIEKRFEQLKTVHEIAPVCLKSEARIEALFTVYFLALLVQALIERELRLAMQREKLAQLPLYPEQRQCKHPTTEQLLRLFSRAERHTLLSEEGCTQQIFYTELTELQRQVLTLLRVPHHAFCP